MAWSEGHFTFLDLTLQAFCLITCTSRCYLSKFWTVSCSDWSAVLIHTFDCDWIWVSDKLLIWSEGYCSVWRNRVGSLSWNRLLFTSIFEGWFNGFIDWNQWITTLEGWGASLRDTLRSCASCISACWSDLGHCWCISCGNFCTILIHSFHCDWSWCTNILFFWRKGNRAIWIDAVFTYTRNCLC